MTKWLALVGGVLVLVGLLGGPMISHPASSSCSLADQAFSLPITVDIGV